MTLSEGLLVINFRAVLTFVPPFLMGLGLLNSSYSCASFPDVHKSPDGVNYISFLVARKGDGNRDGMKQAEAFCSKVNRNHAVIVSETFNYVGTMDEEAYSNTKAEAELKKGNKLATKILPKKDGTIKVPESAVMVGGDRAELEKENANGKGYEYTLQFTCEDTEKAKS